MSETRRALYVPERFAHGYQTLVPETETTCFLSEFYTPSGESGLYCEDPRLGIQWPLSPSELSARDRKWTLLADFEPYLQERMQLSAMAWRPPDDR